MTGEQVREWAFPGWYALIDADKYLRRGSLWEAHNRLHEPRHHIWALWTAAAGALYPSHGLSQALDHDPGNATCGTAWAGPDGNGGPAIAVLRSATQNQAAARMLREFVTEEILGRIAAALNLPDPQLRASLMGSQLIGLAFARYVVGVEPLASMTVQQLTDWYAPVLQHYLTANSPSDAVASA